MDFENEINRPLKYVLKLRQSIIFCRTMFNSFFEHMSTYPSTFSTFTHTLQNTFPSQATDLEKLGEERPLMCYEGRRGRQEQNSDFSSEGHTALQYLLLRQCEQDRQRPSRRSLNYLLLRLGWSTKSHITRAAWQTLNSHN